ncbi:hypothetical protein J4Q44_G00197960 [Coregonus suidteri]|uniref:Uncharacterized protein n=1 Tax=Coregonus suidteri TaxID=861788 RepID=A0AAN8LFE3_9TELE
MELVNEPPVGYLEPKIGWEPQLLIEITETPPDVVEDQNGFEDNLQAQAEKDVEFFDQVRLNIDEAQEKQKESYRRRIKKWTKCFDIRANDLVWKKDERKARPGKPCCSFAPSWGHYPLRTYGMSTTKFSDEFTNYSVSLPLKCFLRQPCADPGLGDDQEDAEQGASGDYGGILSGETGPKCLSSAPSTVPPGRTPPHSTRYWRPPIRRLESKMDCTVYAGAPLDVQWGEEESL